MVKMMKMREQMMRRKERAVTELKEITEIIAKCEVMRLALTDGNKPYIVPLNYGYILKDDTLSIYFHSAKEGKKVEMLRNQPECCFEMDCSFEVKRDEVSCRWTAHYESVVGEGEASIVETTEEKKEAMNAIMHHYGYEGIPEYQEKVLEHTLLFQIKVHEICGKRNLD